MVLHIWCFIRQTIDLCCQINKKQCINISKKLFVFVKAGCVHICTEPYVHNRMHCSARVFLSVEDKLKLQISGRQQPCCRLWSSSREMYTKCSHHESFALVHHVDGGGSASRWRWDLCICVCVWQLWKCVRAFKCLWIEMFVYHSKAVGS